MAAAAEIYRPIGPHTVSDWLALPPAADGSRVELIYGYLHLTPAPSGEHQFASSLLIDQIRLATRGAGRADLYVVPAINVEISTAWRTALIPDVVVLNTRPVGVAFAPETVVLVVEVWSPGNDRHERETKRAGYAAAGVPFLWTVTQDRNGAMLTAHRLVEGTYEVENIATAAARATITAAPVPVVVDLAEFTR
ncbi:Uma2 family endonuclease [Pseudonocardia spinosispora]|uniref:Uma2 family endonuclease n=1 Tax=Pseudonocardia spinosispora TaxID=103441 RepID=UPI0009FDB610|nr:Uma2 family endonuclease [Pseudonocardia spinosispora]